MKFDGKKLRKIREALDLTRADIAEEIGISPHTIYMWESGRRKINALAEYALNCFFEKKFRKSPENSEKSEFTS